MDVREGRLGKNGFEVSVIRDMLDELGKSINEPDKMV
jgi:hypothetical protein